MRNGLILAITPHGTRYTRMFNPDRDDARDVVSDDIETWAGISDAQRRRYHAGGNIRIPGYGISAVAGGHTWNKLTTRTNGKI